MKSIKYVYLHGFASSPQSTKARYLRDRFEENNLTLNILDLNRGDFSRLTLTRQIAQTASQLQATPTVVIGSSFGGLTAAWVAQKYPETVAKIVLLAPAFDFLDHWLPQLGEQRRQQWQQSQYISIYHYGAKRSLLLHYQFLEDLEQYSLATLTQPIPTLILHGVKDEVIPVLASRKYSRERPWVQLQELDSNHSLGDVLPLIWQYLVDFLAIQTN